MAEDWNVRVEPTPVNPVEIKGAIAFSANHARIWAEGTDSEVEKLGGVHSAKGWADETGEEGKAYTDEKIAIAKAEIAGQIATASQGAVTTANSYTDQQVWIEASARSSADDVLQLAIEAEEGARISADNNLQGQIDALSAASDVTDIVGTYAELQAYDTSKLKDNDIIKVLDDSTHSDAPSYYRWDNETETFSYIGSEGPYYTKSEADSKFLTQTDASSTYATQSSLSTKQDTLVSGTNIKTVNNNSLLGSGNISIDSLPTQTGHSGEFLTTNGTNASWATVDALPSQTGQSGKFLTTDGTSASWATVQAGGGAPTLTWYTGNTGTTVTISDTTGASLVKIYKNGILLEPTADYSISGTTLTLVTALVSTDKITEELF